MSTTLTFEKLQLCMSLAGVPVGSVMAGAFVDTDGTATVIIVERVPAPDGWRDHTREVDLTSAELAKLVDDIALAAHPTPDGSGSGS